MSIIGTRPRMPHPLLKPYNNLFYDLFTQQTKSSEPRTDNRKQQ